MDISKLPSDTLLICKAEDFQSFAENVANRILSGQPKPSPKQETEQPISQAEAIKFLGKSRQTIIKWRKQGIIKGHILGGRVYFLKSELLAALKD